MKIDIFCHIVPQNYYDRMLKLPETGTTIKKRTANIPAMVNLEARFRFMDRFAEYCQVVSMAAPPIEAMGDTKLSPELAQIANDGMAELVVKHPDRFPGFVGALPMNNPAAAVEEIDRAVLSLLSTGETDIVADRLFPDYPPSLCIIFPGLPVPVAKALVSSTLPPLEPTILIFPLPRRLLNRGS